MLIHDDILVEGKSEAIVGKEFEHDRFQQAVIFLTKKIESRNTWTCPDNLSIFTVRNYPEKQLFELNMDNLGIKHSCVKVPFQAWRHTDKMEGAIKILETCTTEYVLYGDTGDVVWVENPNTIVDKFLDYDCDLLFGSHDHFAVSTRHSYFSMMHIKNKIDLLKMIAEEPIRRGVGHYINSGAWFGRTENIKDIFKRVSEFIDYDRKGLTTPEYCQIRYDGNNLCDYVENYPYGIPDDEDIFRWIEPDFYPRIKVDWKKNIFLRSAEDINNWLINNWG